jgi:hypothetical protein
VSNVWKARGPTWPYTNGNPGSTFVPGELKVLTDAAYFVLLAWLHTSCYFVLYAKFHISALNLLPAQTMGKTKKYKITYIFPSHGKVNPT